MVGKLIVTTNSYNVVFLTSGIFALLPLILFTIYFWKHPYIIAERAKRAAIKSAALPRRPASSRS